MSSNKCYCIVVLSSQNLKNTTVLKGANLHRFPSNKDAILLGEGRKGIIKIPSMKERIETISDKARKRIAIAAKLIASYAVISKIAR